MATVAPAVAAMAEERAVVMAVMSPVLRLLLARLPTMPLGLANTSCRHQR